MKTFTASYTFPGTVYTGPNLFPIGLHAIGWRGLIHSPMGYIKGNRAGLSGLENVVSGGQAAGPQMAERHLLSCVIGVTIG